MRTFSADRADIEGLRTIEDQYGRRTRICVRGGRESFNVPDAFTGNDDLMEWLKGLPDLDQRDAEKITAEIDHRDPLAPATSEPSNALQRAKAWAIGLSVFAGAVSVPVMFYRHREIRETSLVVLALCVVLGIVLVHLFPLFFTIFRRKPDPRADVGFLVMWPGVAMLLSYQFANDPSHLVDPMQLIYWVLLFLACFVASLFRIAWTSATRWALLAALIIFGSISSIGVTNALDVVPDHSVAAVYSAQVVKLYESHGKTTTYYLRLTPWGPIGYYDDVSVSQKRYERAHVGDVVCTGLHPGFLHAAWYTLVACPLELRVPAFPEP